MKKSTKKKVEYSLIGIGIMIILFLMGIIFYFNVLQEQFVSNNCAYVNEDKPNDNYANWNGCEYTYPQSEGKELYWKIDLRDSLVERINNNEIRITSATIDKDFIQDANFRERIKVGIYSTSNDWSKDTLTWNNKPTEKNKIGEVYTVSRDENRTAYLDDINYLTPDFNDNLLDFINKNIQKNESELSFIFVNEGFSNTIIIGKPQVILETEESDTYYRYEDNKCNEINLFEEEVTSDDYETLRECEENIEEVNETDEINETETQTEENQTEETNEQEDSVKLVENKEEIFGTVVFILLVLGIFIGSGIAIYLNWGKIKK